LFSSEENIEMIYWVYNANFFIFSRGKNAQAMWEHNSIIQKMRTRDVFLI
jgi:hypothetical protein